MKIRKKKKLGISIVVVLLVLMIMTVLIMGIGGIGVNHLSLVNQNKYNARAFYVAESGLQRAFLVLKDNENWTGTSPEFTDVSMPSGDGSYTVSVYNNRGGLSPLAAPNGVMVPPGLIYVMSEGKYLNSTSTVAAVCRKSSVFQMAITTKDWIYFHGNIGVDAYDSRTSSSAPGVADVGTNNPGQNMIYLRGSALTVDGNLYVGPGGNPETSICKTGHPTINGNECVLPKKIPMPDVEIPEGLPRMTFPEGMSYDVDTVNVAYLRHSSYKRPMLASRQGKPKDTGRPDDSGGGGGPPTTEYELAPGDYTGQGYISLSSHETVTLTGPGTYVFDGIYVSGGGNIEVDASNGPVEVYLNGNMFVTGHGQTNGITNKNDNPKPTDLLVYGTDGTHYIGMHGTSDSNMAIYAPHTYTYMVGNCGLKGAIVSRYVSMYGTADFHYDVALKDLMSQSYLEILAWQRF